MLSLVVATVLTTAPLTPAANAAPAGHAPTALPMLGAAAYAPPDQTTLAAINPTLKSIRKRERSRSRYRERRRSGDANGFTQLHAGFFDSDDERATSLLFGFRGGTSFNDRLQLGVGVDWSHRSDRSTSIISELPLPGGGTTIRREELARSSSHLVPMMAFVQLSPGEGLPVKPYFGIGGGYEVLWVSADDFATGQGFDARFGGWGWQGWAGIAVPLSVRTNFSAEVYLNQAELARDVHDPVIGVRVREIVDMDGGGMRFGLNWGF